MTNLIIGGAGFIGKNLIKEILCRNENVVVIDKFLNSSQKDFVQTFPEVRLIVGDASNARFLNDVIAEIKPRTVFHLAANSDIQLSSREPEIDIRETFLTTFALCAVLRNLTVENVFFASSSAVYGPKDGSPVESDFKIPISAYGWMKLASEEILLETSKQGHIDRLTIFRFPNVTGEHMTHGVVFDLVNKMKTSSGRLTVLGDGSQSKPFVLASELSRLIVRSSELKKPINILNISNNNPLNVRKIAELIALKSEKNPEIEYSRTREGWKGDVPEYDLDCSNASEVFGSLEFSSSLDAISQAINWQWEQQIEPHN